MIIIITQCTLRQSGFYIKSENKNIFLLKKNYAFSHTHIQKVENYVI